nr:MAG TPA: hypothetical protein [Caudoviricetes sp.]
MDYNANYIIYNVESALYLMLNHVAVVSKAKMVFFFSLVIMNIHVTY